ncbi:MAG TPA: alpha/beta hydrolase [Candidatus Kryptonia bacterium]
MKRIFFFLLAYCSCVAAQTGDSSTLRVDTSFTVYSAAAKVQKKFPSAKLVLPDLPRGVVADENVVFDSSGSRALTLDVYYPESRSDSLYPGVILIHGGGWSSGDKSMEVPMAQQLAAHGYVAATVEYRLAPEAGFPAAVYDLKSAVRWMRANSVKYHLDTTKIAAYGCSSGGELAAFLGATGNVGKFEGSGSFLDRSSRVQAVVDVDGLLDFMNPNSTKYDTNSASPSAADNWFGGSFRTIPEKWKEASPIEYVDGGTPPMIFINSSLPHYHAGQDETILRLRNWGVYFEVHTIPDTPHPFWLFHPWFDQTLQYTVTFLDKLFK